MRSLSVAIIGAGRIAGGFDADKIGDDGGVYTHAGAFNADGRFLLRTVYDVDPRRARAFQRRWGVASVAPTLDAVVRGDHDVVSVCTPDATHEAIVGDLLRRGAARTLFVEKPLASDGRAAARLARLARDRGVNVVVNYQRRFDPSHVELRRLIQRRRARLLAVNAFYIKGLDHIGVTMIDTLVFLLGAPRRVLAYRRVTGRAINTPTYEFILFHDDLNVTVKTVDSPSRPYSYHLFEIDLLFSDGRITINSNSQNIAHRRVGTYAYRGVRALQDLAVSNTATGYSRAMLGAVDYLHAITARGRRHDVNTPESSLTDSAIVDRVKASYRSRTTLKVCAR